MTGNAYGNIAITVTVVFSSTQPTTPTLGTCPNGTVTGISGSGTTFTFTWTPSLGGSSSFNFTGVTGYVGILTSSNTLTAFAATTATITGTAYQSLASTMTVTFNNSQSGTPTLGTVSNGTASGFSGSGTTFTFTWTPTNTTMTSFNFTNVTGYSGTLTSNSVTPLLQTIATLSGTIYQSLASTVTVTFSNSQLGTPTLGTVSNGTASGFSGSGTTFTFTWTPTNTTLTSFTFTSVTGYSGTLTSSNSLTPLVQTTVSVSITGLGSAYDNYANTIITTFSNSQSSTPTLGSCANGTVSGISGSGTTFTFSWTPSTTSATTFNFTSVNGYSGTLASSNQLTPLTALIVTLSGTSYINYASTITATFLYTQLSTPTLGTCLNGTTSGFSGSGTIFTFTWTPSTSTATSFTFTNLTYYTGTLTSTNSLTPLASTSATLSGPAYQNLASIITVTFSNSQSGTPTLGSTSNGTDGSFSGSGTTFTFTWTPTTTTLTSFTFTNVVGYTGTLTSSNSLTPLAQTTASVSTTGSAYVNSADTITVTFSNTQSSTPTLGSCANGTVSGISGSGITFTFTWTPTSTNTTFFNFTNVSGNSGTVTSTNSITPVTSSYHNLSLSTSTCCAMSGDGTTFAVLNGSGNTTVSVYYQGSLQQTFTLGAQAWMISTCDNGNIISAMTPPSNILYVWSRPSQSSTNWTSSCQASIPAGYYASTVVMSGNGSYVMGSSPTNGTDAISIYYYNGSSLSLQTSVGFSGSTYSGSDMAMNDAGTVAVFNATGSSTNKINFLTRSGTTWSSVTSLGTSTNASTSTGFGMGIDLSNDGSTLFVVGSNDNNGTCIGTVFVYTWNGTTFVENSLPYTKLIPVSRIGSDTGFGNNNGTSQGANHKAIRCNSNGTAFIVGDYLDNSGAGAYWIFTYNGTSWSNTKYTVSGHSGQGLCVSMNKSGSCWITTGNTSNVDYYI